MTVHKTGKTTHEVVYLLTDLTPLQASPRRLLDLNRGHWSIENGLHDVRDVSFGEDRSRLRAGSASQIMAALRNVAICALRLAGRTDVTEATRWASRSMDRPFTILGLTQ